MALEVLGQFAAKIGEPTVLEAAMHGGGGGGGTVVGGAAAAAATQGIVQQVQPVLPTSPGLSTAYQSKRGNKARAQE